MKDPIQVHTRQIDELNRLLAERIDPDTCNPNTAAVVDNSGPKVRADVSRKHQYLHNGHRKGTCFLTSNCRLPFEAIVLTLIIHPFLL